MSIDAHARRHTDALALHPYQRFCGIELVEQDAGHARCRMPVSGNVTNLSDTLHGGVLYSMLDVTSMFATLPTLAPDEYAVTNNIAVSVMSAVPLGAELELEARVVRGGRNMIVTQCSAWKQAAARRTQVAIGQLTKFRMAYDWSHGQSR